MAEETKNLFHAKGVKLKDVADALGVDKSSITRWAKSQFPAERAIDVERVTGGKISRSDLRPDLWLASGDAA